MENKISITHIPGIKIGHAHDLEALTGCTVILCESGAVGGVDQRGGAPGTRDTDLLRPMHLIERVHAVLLSGGSAFGLNAADGVIRFLEEGGVGYDTGIIKVPIVPAAILFDLNIGDPNVRPDSNMGYKACLNASADPPAEGNVGAGCGATVGNLLGLNAAMKSGIGTAGVTFGDDIIVGAIVAANPLGDIVDPTNGRIIAGARDIFQADQNSGNQFGFANSLHLMTTIFQSGMPGLGTSPNTVIGVVATNAKLNKEQINKVAQMAQDGIARAVRPAHTMLDGDTIFGLSMGDKETDVNVVGAWAAEVVSQAIIHAVKTAEPAGGLPSATEYGL